jgi:hypothetical protein
MAWLGLAREAEAACNPPSTDDRRLTEFKVTHVPSGRWVTAKPTDNPKTLVICEGEDLKIQISGTVVGGTTPNRVGWRIEKEDGDVHNLVDVYVPAPIPAPTPALPAVSRNQGNLGVVGCNPEVDLYPKDTDPSFRIFHIKAFCDDISNCLFDDGDAYYEGGVPNTIIEIDVVVIKVDLDIDSDNDDDFGEPDHDPAAEDAIEADTDKPGKYVIVNDRDAESDGVPDYADGFDWDPSLAADGSNTKDDFVQLTIDLPEPIDLSLARLRITYSASDPDPSNPAGVARTPAGVYMAPTVGHLRLWKKDANEARDWHSVKDATPGDFVPSEDYDDLSKLGFGGAGGVRTVKLYVEGIKKSDSEADQELKIEVDPDGTLGSATWTCDDIVKVTVLRMVVIPIGNSLTFGAFVRNGVDESPPWGTYWDVYPYPHTIAGMPCPNGDAIEYQGWRGYLQQNIPFYTWNGEDPNQHGPKHCGYRGAATGHINARLGVSGYPASQIRPMPKTALQEEQTYAIVIYFIGANDCNNPTKTGAGIYNEWAQGVGKILEYRDGKGKTLVLGVTVPLESSPWPNWNANNTNRMQPLNTAIRAHTISAENAVYHVADCDSVGHDQTTPDVDDGLHFLPSGYQQIEQIIRTAIQNALTDEDR